MLDIMKSIYDMMGKYTYPALREEAPREHVESFFQVPGTGQAGFWSERKEASSQQGTYLSSACLSPVIPPVFST